MIIKRHDLTGGGIESLAKQNKPEHHLEPREQKTIIQNIGYMKEIKKEYLDDAILKTARHYNIIDSTDESVRSALESDLNTMSL